MRVLIRPQEFFPKIESCTMSAVFTQAVDHPKFLLVATTPDCPNGQAIKDLVRDNRQKFENAGIRVEELAIDNGPCNSLADDLAIKSCPTAIFYKDKIEKKRFVPSGQSFEEVLAILTDFASLSSRPPAQ